MFKGRFLAAMGPGWGWEQERSSLTLLASTLLGRVPSFFPLLIRRPGLRRESTKALRSRMVTSKVSSSAGDWHPLNKAGEWISEVEKCSGGIDRLCLYMSHWNLPVSCCWKRGGWLATNEKARRGIVLRKVLQKLFILPVT